MKWTAMAAALSGAMMAAGCVATMDMPDGFVQVKNDGDDLYRMRGVSADGVVCALRTHDNPKRGTLAFWSEAVKNELVSSKGYKLIKSEPVQSRAGRPGTLMTFSAERSGTAFTYLLAVFVSRGKVLIAEAGGKADRVKPRLGAIKNAMLSAKL